MAPGEASNAQSGAPSKAPNLVLRRIREQERHETREEFAEAMARVARELGEDVFPDAKYVARLETGDIRYPRPMYRRILSEVCGRPFSELGFEVPPTLPIPALELASPHLPSDGVQDSIKRPNVELRDAIMASGLEISQIARKVGVDHKTVERWITKGRVPHPRHRWKTSNVLGCDESELWPDVSSKQGTLKSLELEGVYHSPVDERIKSHIPGINQSTVKPILRNISQATAVPFLVAFRELQHGYLIADSVMGGLSVTDAVRTQIPLIEAICEITRGADRKQVLEFACRFMEFCGWVHQDAGDITCAMHFTDRALDYAMELGDQRTIAYTLMRKASIATDAGNSAQGLGIINFALSSPDALTPRLRAVIFRQRAHAHAALKESSEAEQDSEVAVSEAIAGVSQEEEDRAPYCSPMYAAMETGNSMVIAGQPKSALSILSKSKSEWADNNQARDYALCVARLATAYAASGEPKQACATAGEAISLASGMGSRRVINQLNTLSRVLAQWRNDPEIIATQEKLDALIDSFKPEYQQ